MAVSEIACAVFEKDLLMDISHEDSRTKYSKYGPNYNVRNSYKYLPCQSFWTWITGKGIPLSNDEVAKAKKIPEELFLLKELFVSWLLIVSFICTGFWSINYAINSSMSIVILFISWFFTVSCFRSLQAIFHYTTHGSIMKNMGRAKRYSLFFITTPILYVGWDDYRNAHVRHHHISNLCSGMDPDQIFIAKQKFRKGMPEFEYWLRVWLTPLKPNYIFNEIIFSLKNSFVIPSKIEIIFRVFFWLVSLFFLYFYNVFFEFIVLFVIPRFIIFPYSMWLQLFTEHLWFFEKDISCPRKESYGKLSWGRFQGRDLPDKKNMIIWIIKILLCDIPVRLFIYPKDLPNHDFHHRYAGVSYKKIADLRVSMECKYKKYGPMREVWGFVSSLRVIRDHLCRNDVDPFI